MLSCKSQIIFHQLWTIPLSLQHS